MRGIWKQVLRKAGTLAMVTMPRRLRHALIRSQLRLVVDLPDELHFKIAKTDEELAGAFSLLHDSYVEMGYMEPHPSGLRVTFYHLLPSTTTLVGIFKGEVVATLSIIRESSHGLPLETDFSVSHLREEGATVAEISSLAVRKDFRKKGGMALFPLFRFLWIYCRFYFAVDYIVMATHPRLSEMFEALILFSALEDKQISNYGFANGSPAVAKVLDLRKAPMLYAAKYSEKKPEQDLYRYMVPPEMGGIELPCIQMPRRNDFRISDPVMTPELMRGLFIERANALADLTLEQARTVFAHYCTDSYVCQVPEVKNLANGMSPSDIRAVDPRFEVRCEGSISEPFTKGKEMPLLVTDVSNQGLGARVTAALKPDKIYCLKVAVAPLLVVELVVKVKWQNQGGRLGLQIIRCNPQWEEFIQGFCHSRADEVA